jgi:hypothetical protein
MWDNGIWRSEGCDVVEQTRFDALVQQWTENGTRRRFLGVLAGLGIGGALLADEGEAGSNNKHKKKRTKRFCLNGKTVKATNKKKKRRLRRKGAVRGRCKGCTPTCPTDGTCGMDDGCGGICGCGAGTVCGDGTCVECTVTCTGSPEECGAELQTAIDGGGNLYVCPGRYARNIGFVAPSSTPLNIYGAGPGDDPATNTILDATGGNATVLNTSTVATGEAVTLSGLRVTGGDAAAAAGGIFNAGALLTVKNCAVVGNTTGGLTAGGIYTLAALTMSNSLVAGNACDLDGPGGIQINQSMAGTASTITNSMIDDNTGGKIGGILVALFDAGHSLTIDSTSQVTNNTARSGSPEAGGIANPQGLGSVDATGAKVTGNTNPQCKNVTGCS